MQPNREGCGKVEAKPVGNWKGKLEPEAITESNSIWAERLFFQVLCALVVKTG